MTGTRTLLCKILNCGAMDLQLLDGIGYDLDDVLERCGYPGERLGLNELMMAVVEMGISDITESVADRIAELEAADELDCFQKEELDLLRKLNPEEDITSFHNYLDTHVYCERHYDIYKEYLGCAFDDFYSHTGLEIGGD